MALQIKALTVISNSYKDDPVYNLGIHNYTIYILFVLCENLFSEKISVFAIIFFF